MSNFKNGNYKKKLIRKFFTTLFLGILIFFVSFFIVVACIIFFGDKSIIFKNLGDIVDKNCNLDIITKLPKTTNFLIVGVDKDGSRTDTMLIANFNTEKEELNILSIPRDTYVIMPEERTRILKQCKRNIPKDGIMKLNEVYSYAGSKRGIKFLKLQIEELLDIKIDYYVKVNLKGFVCIIDKIGGVEFNVPRRMYYKDPTQNLIINLKPGVQVLNGKNAENLVRFRSYKDGDLERIKIQQEFIKAAMKQVMKKENITSNILSFINVLIKYVETDLQLDNIVKYIKHVNNFDINKVHMYIMPCTPKYVDNISYVFVNQREKVKLVEEIFYDKKNVKLESSKGKKIQVLNGTNIPNKAAETKLFLDKENFNVVSVGNYKGEKFKETRIFVKEYGYGEDLKSLFPGSIIIKDNNMVKDYDIVVVIS